MRPVVAVIIGLIVAGLDRGPDHKPVEYPRGNLRTVTVDDVRPNLDVKHEMWSYRFFLDGGVQVFIDFRRADLGSFKGRVLGADLSVVGFRGEQYAVAREYPAENLTFDEKKGRLNVHPRIWFEGGLPAAHRVRYETRKKGISYYADLTFSQIAPGCAWGDGIFRFGDDEIMGLIIPIPYARVTGKIAINSDTMEVSGTGYMDHVFQSDRASKLVDSGYRVVSHDRGWEVGMYFRPTNRYDASVVGYGAFNMGAGLALFRPTGMSFARVDRVDGDDVPSQILLIDDEGRQRVIEPSRNLQRLSLLREVGGIKKFIAKQIAGGDVIIYRGVGTIDVNRPMTYDFFIVD
ncbi:MAG TPA: hypothetical protein VMO47_07680 [Rhodothermales bacterium]|nr:hypothetical protein [Rhodothermales bacterium]